MHIIKGLFYFVFLSFLILGVYFCFSQIKNDNSVIGDKPLKEAYDKGEEVLSKQYVNSCYELRDAARLFYTESSFDTPITSGSVTTLQIYGKKPVSGNWRIDNNGKVILENIVYDSYICNTVMNDKDDKIDCKKKGE